MNWMSRTEATKAYRLVKVHKITEAVRRTKSWYEKTVARNLAQNPGKYTPYPDWDISAVNMLSESDLYPFRTAYEYVQAIRKIV